MTQIAQCKTEKERRAFLLRLEADLKALDDRRRWRKIDFFDPYPKQQEFFDLGAVVPERMLRAGNQIGKSEAGAVEMAYHLTGEYPDDWMGHRFDHAITAWAAGIKATDVRDIQQDKLFGAPGLSEALGTGYVPREAIVGKPSASKSATDLFDTVHIRHKSGGVSTLRFKSYEEGEKKFQGKPVDCIWLDEEPPMEIYTECVARTLKTRGIVYTTWTPLNGKTELFNYMTDPTAKKFRREVLMTFRDIPGMTQEEIERRLAAFPAYQRDARLYGIPMRGSGRIFVTPEESLYFKAPIDRMIPPQWYKLWAIDFGIALNHKFGAILQAWDKDADVIYILDAFKIADQTPVQHAVRMKQRGILVPVAWPADGGNREKSSGEEIQLSYKKAGLKMCASHATFETGGYSTEAGIIEMNERIQSARYKVAQHLIEWFEEYRDYHRKDGLIVKQNDDIMSASRVGVMARRFGQPVILGPRAPVRNNGPNDGVAAYTDLYGRDLF